MFLQGGLIQSGPAVSTAAPVSSQPQPYVQGGSASGVQGRPGVYQGMPQGASGTPQQQPPQQQGHSGPVPQGQVVSELGGWRTVTQASAWELVDERADAV